MPAHPVSRLVRFTLAVGANVIFDHLGYRRRPTVHPVRVIDAVELVACPVFTIAEQTRQRLTFGDVERYLAQLAAHPPDCTCGRCPLVLRVTAQRVYAIASAGSVRSGQPECGPCADRRSTASTWLVLGARSASICGISAFRRGGSGGATKTRETPVSDSWRPPRPPTR